VIRGRDGQVTGLLFPQPDEPAEELPANHPQRFPGGARHLATGRVDAGQGSGSIDVD